VVTSWLDRIAAARTRGSFTPDEHTLSSQFTTCALSEHRGRFQERACGDIPVDGVLYRLAMDFWGAVHVDGVEEAARIHLEIAQRVRKESV